MAKNDKASVTESATESAGVDKEHFNPVIPAGMKVPNFSEKEQTSFPAYWQPEIGKWFMGVLVGRDSANPKFIRYLFRAILATPCQRGSKVAETVENEMVNVGEEFSVSHYSGLAKLLDEYLGLPFPVGMRIEAIKKTPTKDDNDFWHFDLKLEDGTKKLLTKYRAEKRLAESKSDRPALAD
jgi:hypothetical protein